jgi:hypothetical protein
MTEPEEYLVLKQLTDALDDLKYLRDYSEKLGFSDIFNRAIQESKT